LSGSRYLKPPALPGVHDSNTGLFINTHTVNWDYKDIKPRIGNVVNEKRRLYVHIYYNDQHAADDKIRFNKRLDETKTDICKGNMKPEREKECLIPLPHQTWIIKW
jgi:hypothetical protein